MANTRLSAALAALLLLALVATPATASHFIAWAGPGCSRASARHSACGCSDIRLHGGYQFIYTGQTAAVYNQLGCSGVAHTRFGSSARGCSSFGWKSIFIQC